MPQWKQIQWPWPLASYMYTLTFWEDALGSKQPGKCSLWSWGFQKISISHLATCYGEMWDGAGFLSFFGLLCGILIPQPEIKPTLPAVEAQSLNHLTTRETPGTGSFDHTVVGNVTPETYKGWRDFWSSLPSPAPQSLSLVCLELKGIWRYLKVSEIPWKYWHHWLDGRESEWTPGVGDGQGGLACCDSWGRRVGHNWVTELNWTDRHAAVKSKG